jgi:hypothetical protein
MSANVKYDLNENRAWWYTFLIPDTREVEAGES